MRNLVIISIIMLSLFALTYTLMIPVNYSDSSGSCNLTVKWVQDRQRLYFVNCNVEQTSEKLEKWEKKLIRYLELHHLDNLDSLHIISSFNFTDEEKYFATLNEFSLQKATDPEFVKIYSHLFKTWKTIHIPDGLPYSSLSDPEILSEHPNAGKPKRLTYLDAKYLYDKTGIFSDLVQMMEGYGFELKYDYCDELNFIKHEIPTHLQNKIIFKNFMIPSCFENVFKARPLTEKGKPWPE